MHQFQPLSAKSSLRLLLLIILTYGAGFLTSFWTSNPASINWYHALYQAPGTPPDWMFAFAWFVLYGLISISAWLVWSLASHRYFYFQLVTQILWVYTFFEAHMLFYAFLIMIALTFFVVEMMKEFYRYSKLSARLLIPYLVWVVFAAYLNAYAFMYN